MSTLNKYQNINTNPWELKINISQAGSTTNVLSTAGTFLDRNILITTETTATTRTASNGIVSLTASSGLTLLSTAPSQGTYYTLTAKGKGIVETGTGWISSGSTTSNEAENFKYIEKSILGGNVSGIPSSSYERTELLAGYYIKIPKGYNPNDRYIYTQASGESTVINADNFSLEISNVSSDTEVSIGNLNNNYYPVIANDLVITGTLTAGVSGWFSNGNATDSDTDNVTVGKIIAATVTATGIVNATSPTLASISKTISSATRIAATPTTTTNNLTNKFFISIRATAPATTIDLTKSVSAGYIGSNTQIYTLAKTTTSTQDYYIPINAGSYTATYSTSSNSTITPTVSISNSSTYGVVTTTTSGVNYITINPNATATNWSVTPKAQITSAGYIQTGNVTGTTISNTPTIENGTNYYIPIVEPTFSGGTLTGTNASANFNLNISTTNTDVYNNGLSIATIGGAGRTKIIYSNSAGVIAAHNNTTALTAISSSTTWSGNSYYLTGIKLETPTSGIRCFDITVPNGNTTDFITFHFEVDSNSNVTITDTHTN